MAGELVQVMGILETRTEDVIVAAGGGTGRQEAIRILALVVEDLRK